MTNVRSSPSGPRVQVGGPTGPITTNDVGNATLLPGATATEAIDFLSTFVHVDAFTFAPA